MNISLTVTASLLLAVFIPPAAGQIGTYVRAKLLSIPEYKLPDEYKSAGIDGELSLMVEVDKNGTVKRAEVWTGPFWPCGSKLDSEVTRVRNEVRDTMMQAKFSPAIRNGKPQSDRVLMNFLVGKAYEDAKGPASSPTATIVHRPELNKSALSLPKPDYPRGARGPSLISIRVIIDEQGKVISAGSVGGGAEMSFSDAARSSACKAKFAPFILDGLPVKVTGELSYGFGLVTR